MKFVVIGGVAGGASAAARLRRLEEEAEITIYERGEHVSFANCGLPYHVGGVIENRDDLLLQTPESLRRRHRLDVRVMHEVLHIDRVAKTVTVKNHRSGETFTDSYDALVLAPGAKPIALPVPGATHPAIRTLRTMGDMDAIVAAVDSGVRRAVVIGGGYIGIEMAENLVQRGLSVVLAEAAPQALTFLDPDMASFAHTELRAHGVELLLGDPLSSFETRSDGALEVVLRSGRRVESGLVLSAVGVVPESSLAKEAGLALGETGAIRVDANMRTSDPSIYAVGDAVEVTHFVSKAAMRLPLAGPANRQGRIAANAICGIESTYKDTQGTAILKVFELACGATGANARMLTSASIAFRSVTVHAKNHAGYYPSATPIHLKVLYSPDDGRILGAQACGVDGVDKRIDVLATAIRHHATVWDLEDYELAYAPPFGSAKDPVNMAGFVACNDLRGLAPVIDSSEARKEQEAGSLFLDVRTPTERAAGTIPGSVGIPLDELRDRMSELPKSRRIVVFCAAGQRAYFAQRILMQRGYQVVNLTGGYASYPA